MSCGIYKITNLINGKIYIGQSKYIERRFIGHLNEAENGNRSQVFYNAIRKYGKENFILEILKECSKENLDIFECFFIRVFSSWHRDIGYNRTFGGKYGRETLYKVMKLNGEKRKSQIVTDETRKKQSNSSKGKPKSEKHRKNLSENHWTKKLDHSSFSENIKKGWSNEVKEKQSKRYRKPIICIENGIEYEWAREAAEKLNISVSSIKHHINGRALHAGGYHFIKKENINKL